MWTTVLSGTQAFTNVKYGPKGILAASCWDNNIYLINGSSSGKSKFTLRAPAFSLAWGQGVSAEHLFSGGAEQHISVYDSTSGRLWDIGGEHNSAISSIACAGPTTMVSGGFDGQLQIADTRRDSGIFYQLPSKIIDMDLDGETLMVAMTGQLVGAYDIRQLSQPVSLRKINFKHPIKSIAAFSGGKKYAASSVASRVVVETIDDPANNFSFRAHQTPSNTFMVSDIAVSRKNPEVMVSAGGDRSVKAWDLGSKTKVREYMPLPMPAHNICLSNDDSMLAVSVADDSYTRTRGVTDIAGQLLVCKV